jgi:hypothetical protein
VPPRGLSFIWTKMAIKFQDFEVIQEHKAASLVKHQLQQLDLSTLVRYRRSTEQLNYPANSCSSIGSPLQVVTERLYEAPLQTHFFSDPLGQLGSRQSIPSVRQHPSSISRLAPAAGLVDRSYHDSAIWGGFSLHCQVTDLLVQDRPLLKDIKTGLSVKAQIAVSGLVRHAWKHLSLLLGKKALMGGMSQASFKKLETYRAPSCNPHLVPITDHSAQTASSKNLHGDSRLRLKMGRVTTVLDASSFEAEGRAYNPVRHDSPTSLVICTYESDYSSRPLTDRRHKAPVTKAALVRHRGRQLKETLPPIHAPTVDKSFCREAVRSTSHYSKADPPRVPTKPHFTRHGKPLSNHSSSPSKHDPTRVAHSKRSFAMSDHLNKARLKSRR